MLRTRRGKLDGQVRNSEKTSLECNIDSNPKNGKNETYYYICKGGSWDTISFIDYSCPTETAQVGDVCSVPYQNVHFGDLNGSDYEFSEEGEWVRYCYMPSSENENGWKKVRC